VTNEHPEAIPHVIIFFPNYISSPQLYKQTHLTMFTQPKMSDISEFLQGTPLECNSVYLALGLGCGGGAAPSASCGSRGENRVRAGDAW
jgi:hypothetical protein